MTRSSAATTMVASLMHDPGNALRRTGLLLFCAAAAACVADPASPPRFERAAAHATSVDATPSASAPVLARISMPSRPFGIAVNQAGLAAISNPPPGPSLVVFFDSRRIARLDSMVVGSRPNAVVFNRAGDTLYVGDQASGASGVSVVDVVNRRVVNTLRVASEVFSAVLTPDGSRLFVGTSTGSVLEVDTETLRQTRRLDLGGAVNGLAVDSTGSRLYVTNVVTGDLVEVDVASFAVIRSFDVGGRTQGVVVAPDGSRVLVADETGFVHDVDIASGTWTSVPTASAAFGLADASVANRVFVIEPAGLVEPYDWRTRSLGLPWDVPGELRRGAFYAPTRALMLTNYRGSSLIFLQN